MATYLNMLLGFGFDIGRIVEWGPSLEQVAERPDFAPERERPPFLLLSARKRA
jgi:hypothetical protein